VITAIRSWIKRAFGGMIVGLSAAMIALTWCAVVGDSDPVSPQGFALRAVAVAFLAVLLDSGIRFMRRNSIRVVRAAIRPQPPAEDAQLVETGDQP
jgi:hypothetical protein